MRKYVCGSCGRVWYSAGKTDEPCEDCGGLLSEKEGDAGERGGE